MVMGPNSWHQTVWGQLLSEKGARLSSSMTQCCLLGRRAVSHRCRHCRSDWAVAIPVCLPIPELEVFWVSCYPLGTSTADISPSACCSPVFWLSCLVRSVCFLSFGPHWRHLYHMTAITQSTLWMVFPRPLFKCINHLALQQLSSKLFSSHQWWKGNL